MDDSHFTTIVGESAIAESEGSHLFVALARSGGFRPRCGPPIATLTFFGTYTTSLRNEHSPTADGIIAFDFTDQFSEGDIGTFEVKKLNGPAYDIEVKITHIRKKGMNGVFKPDVVVSFPANQYYPTLIFVVIV